MTKEQHYQALFEAIHEATQLSISVRFSEDFGGTILVSTNDGHHAHCGMPGGNQLDMVKCATAFINKRILEKEKRNAQLEAEERDYRL